jgi:NAD(P)H-hydrate epimerase
MREIEKRAEEEGLPPSTLMERAGLGIAQEVRKLLSSVEGRHILVLVGPGNNGGDGLVCARYLAKWGGRVCLYLTTERKDVNFKLCQDEGIPSIEMVKDEELSLLRCFLSSSDMVIDAVLGTGKARPLEDRLREAMQGVDKARKERPSLYILALDLPSGLDADTGEVDEACPFADLTVTLGFPKVGLFLSPGAERAGRIVVADIGIPSYLASHLDIEIIDEEWARKALPHRPCISNKGTFGRVLVISGSPNYIGASYLCCEAALRVGAGMVTLACPENIKPILASKLTEVTYLPLPESEPGVISSRAVDIVLENLSRFGALILGPGLGKREETKNFVTRILFSLPEGLPLVVDADGLNILSQIESWWEKLRANAILTPHPGEMGGLCKREVIDVQSHRLEVAKESAARWGKTMVLKGAYTVVSEPQGRAYVLNLANPGLSSAGTGDVLTGAIGGLLAQGLLPSFASCLGAYVHGIAGEKVREELGNMGMIASDLLSYLPLVLKELRNATRC